MATQEPIGAAKPHFQVASFVPKVVMLLNVCFVKLAKNPKKTEIPSRQPATSRIPQEFLNPLK
jgi:hypothetical protein